MGERPIFQPGVAGTLTPEAKRRPVEAMPSPQGNAKEYRPGSWSRGEPVAAAVEKAEGATAKEARHKRAINALCLEPPVEGELSRALENYEDYYGLA